MTSYDLTLLLVSDAEAWGHYVTSHLAKFQQVRHQSIQIDNLLYENPPEVTQACQESAVVMLLVTPELVEFMHQKAGWFSKALQGAPATSAVVLFLLVEETDSKKVRDIAERDYASAEWNYFDPGYEVSEVHQKIAEVLDIVEKCQAARKKALEKGEETTVATSDKVCDKEETTAEAKSETLGGQELPGTAEQAEAVRVKKKAQSPPSQKNPHNMVQLFPSVLYESGVRVAMVFKEQVRGNITLKVEHTDIHLTPDKENETVFTFVAPELPPGKHKVLIMEGEKRRARSSLTVRGAELGLFSSPRYLCQVLGVADLRQLDLRLKEVFTASMPPATSGLDTIFHHLSDMTEQQQTKRSEVLHPTLLHYAAAYGLSEFCAALLECAGSSQAFLIHNCEGQDPAEMAAAGGFQDLENYIVDFMQMQTAKEVYDRYLIMHPMQDPGSDSDEYEDMSQVSPSLTRKRTTSEPAVSVTLPPAPPPRHQSLTSCTETGAGRADRPPLPAPRPKDTSRESARSKSERRTSPPSHLHAISEVEQKSCTLPATASRLQMSAEEFMGMGRTDPYQPKLLQGSLGSRSQNELIELHDMVKSKEINLNEARMLFNAWQHRYGKTPSSSFKERQKELTDIKTEYQQLRETLNTQGKSKSLFTRLGLGGKPAKSTVKVHITDPVLQRQQKKGTKVYTKSASTSQLLSDRASSASTVSSSSSSRDSGWSQGSRDSHLSSTYEGDSERDEVFEQRGSMRRSQSTRDSTKRVSLGHQYLQQTEEEMDKADTPGPPALPPRTNRPPLPGSPSSSRAATSSRRH